MKKYNFSADLLRVIAIAGVVIIHTANSVFGRPDYVGGMSWWLALVLNSFSRVAIPLFIMVSGYFILAKDESYGATLKRTFERLVIPLLFWFLMNVLWNGPAREIAYWRIKPDLITRLFTVNVFDLYFFIILIGLYVIAPVLRAYLHPADERKKRIFSNSLLAFGVITFASEYAFSLCSPANSLLYWVPYTGLFVAGYALGNMRSVNRAGMAGIYAIALAITIGMGALYFRLVSTGNMILGAHGCLSFYTDSYLSINVVAMAICLFGIIMHSPFTRVPEFIRRIVYSIARNTMGIYILHTFVISVLDYWHVFDRPMPLPVFVIGRWLVVFVISYIYAWAFMRIPFLRWVFGEKKSATS